MDVLAGAGVPMEGDILVQRANYRHLTELVDWYVRRGVPKFNYWYLSLFNPADKRTARQIPRYREAVPHILASIDHGLAMGGKSFTSLHTPACVVPGSHWSHLYYAPELDMWVVNADGRAFWMEESPMEGGSPLHTCEDCLRRPRCLGPRKDYLDLFGPEEFVPIPRAAK